MDQRTRVYLMKKVIFQGNIFSFLKSALFEFRESKNYAGFTNGGKICPSKPQSLHLSNPPSSCHYLKVSVPLVFLEVCIKRLLMIDPISKITALYFKRWNSFTKRIRKTKNFAVLYRPIMRAYFSRWSITNCNQEFNQQLIFTQALVSKQLEIKLKKSKQSNPNTKHLKQAFIITKLTQKLLANRLRYSLNKIKQRAVFNIRTKSDFYRIA